MIRKYDTAAALPIKFKEQMWFIDRSQEGHQQVGCGPCVDAATYFAH